jgi:hypothetical protein
LIHSHSAAGVLKGLVDIVDALSEVVWDAIVVQAGIVRLVGHAPVDNAATSIGVLAWTEWVITFLDIGAVVFNTVN